MLLFAHSNIYIYVYTATARAESRSAVRGADAVREKYHCPGGRRERVASHARPIPQLVQRVSPVRAAEADETPREPFFTGGWTWEGRN